MGNIEVKSNVRACKNATNKAMKKAARMIGGTIEGHAKELCPVDTGLLRNSITFAIGGSAPNITEYKSNDKDKNHKQIEAKTGQYEGEAPRDDDGQVTVYIGTNVQYAPYQELGAPNVGENGLPARPFLRPAMENFKDEIEQIIEQCLGKL